METLHNPLDDDFGGRQGLSLSTRGRDSLSETARWAKFLSILTFIFAGFIALIGIFAGTFFSAMGLDTGLPIAGGALTIFYLFIAGLTFLPGLFMYRFATYAKQAVRDQSTGALDDSLVNMKSLFKFYGIATLIVLVIYGLIFLIAIVSGVGTAMF